MFMNTILRDAAVMKELLSQKNQVQSLLTHAFLALTFVVLTGVSVVAQSDGATLSGLSSNIPAEILTKVKQGDYPDAASRLESFIDDESGSPKAWYLLGYVRNRLSVHEEAYNALSVARRLIGGTPDPLHRELGYAMAGQAQWTGALEHLSKVNTVTPKIRLTMGRCQLELKRFNEALNTLEPLTDGSGEHTIRARFLRALAYDGQVRRSSAARSELEKGLSLKGADQLHLSLSTILGMLRVLKPSLSRQYLDLFTRETIDWRRGQFIQQFQHEEMRQAIEKLVGGQDAPRGEDAVAMIKRIRESAEGEARAKLTKLSNFFDQIGQLPLSEDHKRKLVKLTINPILSGTGIETASGDQKTAASSG